MFLTYNCTVLISIYDGRDHFSSFAGGGAVGAAGIGFGTSRAGPRSGKCPFIFLSNFQACMLAGGQYGESMNNKLKLLFSLVVPGLAFQSFPIPGTYPVLFLSNSLHWM